jgi:hypothetical protein
MPVSGVNMSSTRDPHDTEYVVRLATFDFKLNRCVRYPEMVLQLVRYRAKYLFTASYALFGDHHVTTARDNSRSYRPDMQVMHLQNAVNAGYGLLESEHVHSFWYCFQ